MRPNLMLTALVLSVLCLGLLSSWPKAPSVHEEAAATIQAPGAPTDAAVTVEPLAREISGPVLVPRNLLEGTVDVSNRYAFTVKVEAHFSAQQEGQDLCSGLLLTPRIVLTAGHCVCAWHKPEKDDAQVEAVIDLSDCASHATVHAMIYKSKVPGRPPTALHANHRGEIRPHPELRVVRDALDKLTTIHANLALIFLEEPVLDITPAPRIAAPDARLNEPLTTVGYGNDEKDLTPHGDRRFNTSHITAVSMNKERIALTQPKRALYQNDSGGPCLQSSSAGDAIVGISNRGLGNESSCSSIDSHREWLAIQTPDTNKTQE
jgi:hypothetical protein